MKKVHFRTDILGAYTLEKKGSFAIAQDRFVSSGKMEEFLPIVNLFSFNTNEVVKLSDGKHINNDIVSHASYANNSKYSTEVMSTSKLSVDQNDLFSGNISVYLNFTSEMVTVSEPNGVRKVYQPLNFKRFQQFTGHFIKLNIYYFNHPRYLEVLLNDPNFFKREAERLEGINLPRVKITRDVYNYLANQQGLFKDDPLLQVESSVRVITISTINEHVLKESDLECDVTGNTYSLQEISKVDVNPNLRKVLFQDSEVLEALRPNDICIFINDPESITKPYFISIAGVVHKVTKVCDLDRKPGLYIAIKNLEGKIEYIEESLDSLSTSNYIYESQEEAMTGADRKGNFVREYEDLKEANRLKELKRQGIHDEETAALKRKHNLEVLEHERELARIRKENEEYKFELERRRAELTTDREVVKSQSTVSSTESKLNYERYMDELNRRSSAIKHHYEVEKYGRDSTLETIKTVGSIVAAGAGIVFLYSKFAK